MIDPLDTATLPLPSATRLRFQSEDRIYTAVLTQDLFEQWMVMQSWGGRHNQRGGGKIIHVDSFETGLAMMRAIARRREKHGYKLANIPGKAPRKSQNSGNSSSKPGQCREPQIEALDNPLAHDLLNGQ